MNENEKAFELTDSDLEQVSGGAKMKVVPEEKVKVKFEAQMFEEIRVKVDTWGSLDRVISGDAAERGVAQLLERGKNAEPVI